MPRCVMQDLYAKLRIFIYLCTKIMLVYAFQLSYAPNSDKKRPPDVDVSLKFDISAIFQNER